MLRIAASLFSLLLSPAKAGELPPVLNYQPHCTADIVSQQQLAKVLVVTGKSHQQERDKVTRELIQQMRQLAYEQHADAVLLTDIATKTRLAKNSGQTPVRRLLVSANLIRFCPNDASLSDQPAAFDENGSVSSSLSSLKFEVSSKEPVPQPQAPEPMPVRRHVSLNEGAYGFLPGMTPDEVLQLAGQPDVQIRLQQGRQAWAYGRELWLVFDSTLQQIQYHPQLLSGYGSNLAELSEQFDQRWQLDGRLPYRASLADVKQYLHQTKQSFQQGKNAAELVLTDAKHQLVLKFTNYQQVHNQPAVPLLAAFSLLGKAETQLSMQPEALPWQQLQPLLAPLALQQTPQLSQLDALLALPQHQVIERKEKTWLVFGEHLQLHIQNDRVRAVRLTPSLFLTGANKTFSPKMLHALGLAENGKQMLSRFADMQQLGDKLVLSLNAGESEQMVELTVDPDSEELVIEQVLIRYY